MTALETIVLVCCLLSVNKATNPASTISKTGYDVKLDLMEKEIQALKTLLATVAKMSREKEAYLTSVENQLKKCSDNNDKTAESLSKLQISFTALETKAANIDAKQQVLQNDVKYQGTKTVSMQSQIHSVNNEVDTLKPNLFQQTWSRTSVAYVTAVSATTLRSLDFSKRSSSSNLRVAYYGNLNVDLSSGATSCARWYFEFNGRECSWPATIEGVIQMRHGDSDIAISSIVEGICSGLPAGRNHIAFKLGQCYDTRLKFGTSYTGWGSVSRIIVEEIPVIA